MGSKYVITGTNTEGHWSNWSYLYQKKTLEDPELYYDAKFVKDVWFQPEDPIDSGLTELSHIIAKKRPALRDVLLRSRYEPLASNIDRLAMPAPPDTGLFYFTYVKGNAPVYWYFMYLYHDLVLKRALAEKDETLLEGARMMCINYAFSIPYNPEFHKGEDFHSDPQHQYPDEWYEEFRSCFWRAMWAEFDALDWHSVHCHVRAHTSIGDNKDVYGNPFSTKDILTPVSNRHTSPKVKKKNGSTIKAGYINQIDQWRSDAQYFERLCHDAEQILSGNNLEDRLNNDTIARCLNFIRESSPDGSLIDEPYQNLKDINSLTSKNRSGSIVRLVDNEPKIMYFEGQTGILNQYYREKYGMKGFAARRRRVNCTNIPLQRALNFFLHGVTKRMESGDGGFLAYKKPLLERHEQFRRLYNKVIMLKGDRTNAEKYISSNRDMMEKLWDPVFHKLIFNGYRPKIMPDKDRSWRVMSQTFGSGEATTSFENILAGNSEKIFIFCKAATILYKWDLKRQLEFIKRAVDMITTHEFAVLEISSNMGLWLNLSTDDIGDEIGSNSAEELEKFKAAVDVEWLKERKMKIEFAEATMSYGVLFNNGVWTPGTGSSLKQVGSIENPGDYLRDCFSVYTRVMDSGTAYEFNSALKETLRKFNLPYSKGIEAYKDAVPLYARRCSEFKTALEDDVNLYSSSQIRFMEQLLRNSGSSEKDIELALNPNDVEKEIPMSIQAKDRFLNYFKSLRQLTTYA